MKNANESKLNTFTAIDRSCKRLCRVRCTKALGVPRLLASLSPFGMLVWLDTVTRVSADACLWLQTRTPNWLTRTVPGTTWS